MDFMRMKWKDFLSNLVLSRDLELLGIRRLENPNILAS
nr:hypothetical protein Iba_scaffold19727CG0010 [Ipomoea batatas]